MLAAALLALGILWGWPIWLVMVFGISVVTTLIGLLGAIDALSGRQKIIAETMAQIRNSGQRAQPDPQQPGDLGGGPDSS